MPSPVLSFDPLPVIPRTNARDPGEKTRKIERVIQSYLKTDLTDGHVGIIEIKACLLYLQMIEIASQRISRLLSEPGRQNGGAATRPLGQFLRVEPQLDMLFHIRNDAIDDIDAVPAVRTALRIPFYTHIGCQPQETVQAGDDITDVVARIPEQKRVIDLFEGPYDIRYFVVASLINGSRPLVFRIAIGQAA